MGAFMSRTEDAVVTAARGGVARILEDGEVSASTGLVEIIMSAKQVQTDEQMQELVDAAKACKLAHKKLDDQRKSITAPLKQAMDAANDLANQRLKMLKSAMDRVKSLYDDFTMRKQAAARRIEAEEKARAAAAAAKQAAEVAAGNVEDDDDLAPEASVYVPPPPKIVQGGIGKMHQTTVKTMVVVDLVAAARAYPHLLKVEVIQAEAKAELERLRRDDPDAQLEGFKLEIKTSSVLS